MARILITTEPARTPGGGVMLDERIVTSDLDSDHFASMLIERIGWALADADDVCGPAGAMNSPTEGARQMSTGVRALEPT